MKLVDLDRSRIDEPMPDLVARFTESGYLFFRELLPVRDVLDLRDVVLRTAERLGWLDPSAPLASATPVRDLKMGAYDDPRWIELLRDVVVDETFHRLRTHPLVLRAVSPALEGARPVSEHGDICRVVSDSDPERTTRAHQDRFYIKGEGLLATAWLPLGMCPRELGPLAILPRSHHDGLRPHLGEGMGRQGCAFDDDATWHASDLECGDVLVFGGLTVHGALPNRTPRKLRLSVDYRFRPAT